MARRHRGGDESPLSLFSFQDIITSITGAMFFVVFMLILNIVGKEFGEPAGTTSEPAAQQDMDRLAKARTEAAEIRSKLTASPPPSVKAPDAAAVATLIQAEDERGRRLAKSLAATRSDADSAEAQAEILRITLKKTMADADARRKAMEEEEANLKKKSELLEKTEADAAAAARQASLVIFNPDLFDGKKPILVECSGDRVAVKPSNSAQTRIFEEPGGVSYLPMVEKFKEWLRSRASGKSEYVVILVKPSAIPYYAVALTSCEELGYETIFEPLEEEKTGVF